MSRPEPVLASSLPRSAFRAPFRVRFGDCDPAGILFFPNWFIMASAAVEDLFRLRLGIDFHALHAERGIGTGFVHAGGEFMRPAMMGDEVLLTPLLRRLGNASYALDMHVHRGEEELARLDLVTATNHLATRTSTPVPPELRAALLRYQLECGPMAGQEIPA
ncbi:thioesterase family protein [Pararoseomonas sp. SCSIO 73927]|uniref:acyl-CoA thioesterase n=1 Tax=Pararoseomonas sp. SCSIO 73927 TaxID=3114537 RepID=UPI0030CD9751